MGRCGRVRERRRAADHPHCCHITEQKYIDLIQWMKLNGFDVRHCHLRPAKFTATGRGLMAAKAFRPHDLIIAIPECLLITPALVRHSYLGVLLDSLPRVADNLQILCVFLICERHRGKASFWWPYINTLPTSYTIPSYWTSAELHLLPHPSRESALRQIRDMKDSFDSASHLFRAVEKEWTEFEDIFTFEAYRWAWSTVNTRAVFMPHDLTTLESGDPHGNPAKCLALAPLLDLLNHSSHVEVAAGFNAVTRHYEIRTLTPCSRHDQVFICYGPHDNTRLLTEYGFVLPHNQHDVVLFNLDHLRQLAVDFNVSDTRRKIDLIRENDLHVGMCCSMDGLLWKLTTALRILALDSGHPSLWKAQSLCKSPEIESKVHLFAQRLLKQMTDSCHMPQELRVTEKNLTFHEEMIFSIFQETQLILDYCLGEVT
ncbi:hypothetical protein NP493_77g00028 [Ridgeia piscesae]|uniref:SET domain-containing protein n=1 Tax=Ridgeia piscesae TaxID=27915 RepID=A0AAD9P949_RIDPI|nr:hypothetical protein NP493_77g00028 [Ridgeia piscesae]